MKRLPERSRLTPILVLAVLTACPAFGQEAAIAGQRRPAQVSFVAAYQQYDSAELLESGDVHQLSMTFSTFIPIRRYMALSLRANRVHGGGDRLAPIQGFNDAQLAFSYWISLGQASLVTGLAATLPTGATALTADEFETLAIMSRNAFDFRVPSLGQGAGMMPSVTLAFPVSDRLVVGAGLSYRLRGAFEPVTDMAASYDPGDEMLLTGGFDVRVATNSTISSDISYVRYSTDRLGDEPVYKAGDKITAALQVQHDVGRRAVEISARYRSRGNSTIVAADDGGIGRQAARHHFELQGRYAVALGSGVRGAAVLEADRFSETSASDALLRYAGGVNLRLQLPQQIGVPVYVRAVAGDVPGFEVGAGMDVQF